jgi:hypothetical protein
MPPRAAMAPAAMRMPASGCRSGAATAPGVGTSPKAVHRAAFLGRDLRRRIGSGSPATSRSWFHSDAFGPQVRRKIRTAGLRVQQRSTAAGARVRPRTHVLLEALLRSPLLAWAADSPLKAGLRSADQEELLRFRSRDHLTRWLTDSAARRLRGRPLLRPGRGSGPRQKAG